MSTNAIKLQEYLTGARIADEGLTLVGWEYDACFFSAGAPAAMQTEILRFAPSPNAATGVFDGFYHRLGYEVTK